MTKGLSRLLAPKSIALFGGGWAANVIAQLQKSGFAGSIWPVHPTRDEIGGVACFKSMDELPSAPDASFVGVNREASIDVISQLSAMGAGGATCFASGFLESADGENNGGDLQRALVEAAGEMPILGPNCYGFLNYLDNVTLWPDQHGGKPVKSGVGIIAQSSNIAINMTMQRRGLPIAMVVTAGNQAQTSISDVAMAMIADERVTAIGLYLEGLGDLPALERLMTAAHAAGKSVAVLKTGKSESAQKAALTHTASMAGSADFSSALFERLGMVEVHDVETFLEVLKLLHVCGPIEGNSVVSVSCSGGEAGLIADMAEHTAINFRSFNANAAQKLKADLGPIVTISNPLDYHTFIWGDVARMTSVFTAVSADGFDFAVFVLDLPRSDICDPSDFQCAVDAICAAKKKTGAKVAALSLLPENLDEAAITAFAEAGVVCLNGMQAGLRAIEAAIKGGEHARRAEMNKPLAYQPVGSEPRVRDEAEAKARLKAYGAKVPKGVVASHIDALVAKLGDNLQYPVALKALGINHKTEVGGVRLGLKNVDEVRSAFGQMPKADAYLCEEMVCDVIAEMIIGVSHHANGAQMLTIGAGGIYAEILQDSANLLLPVDRDAVLSAIKSLRIFPLLNGYRGKPAADLEKIVDAVMAIAEFAGKQGSVVDLDVNPLMVCADEAIVADALIITC